MITCATCQRNAVDPPARVADVDAAIAADWRSHIDAAHDTYWECPECRDDPWAPAVDLDSIVRAMGLENRSRRSQEKAELLFHLPGYDVGGRIAEGGMAVIYEGTENHTGNPIVVKIMRRNVDARPDAMLRFQREVEALLELQHPNVVELYEHGVLTERMFLVMERVGNESLKDVLRRGRLPLGRALELADDVCAALEHTHAAGLVHRDVKPSNILVDDRGRAKLADFGLCRKVVLPIDQIAATGTEEAVGTPAYLAPEIVKSPGDPTPLLDVWSMGVLLYELVTGRPAKYFNPPFELERAHPSLQPVLRGALAQDPDVRTPSIAELRAQIRSTRPFWRARLRKSWRWVGRGRQVPKNGRDAWRSRLRTR